MKYSQRSLMIVATLVFANGIWALLVTVWAQTVESALTHLWFPTSVIKPEYVDGAAAGATFAAATRFAVSQSAWWKRVGLVAILLMLVGTTYLGIDQLYRRFADFSFGVDPLNFTIRLGVTLATAIPLMVVLKDTADPSTGNSSSLHSSLPGQFTIRQLLAGITLFAVYCAALRLATLADPFAPVANNFSTRIMMSIRWQLWFLSAGIWSILPVAWAITRRRRLSKQIWMIVMFATLASVITAFPLFTYLGRYLNGVWNNPLQRLLTGLLLPFLIGFIATAIPNLLVLVRLKLLSAEPAQAVNHEVQPATPR